MFTTENFGFFRYATGFCVSAAILAGCGGAQAPMAPARKANPFVLRTSRRALRDSFDRLWMTGSLREVSVYAVREFTKDHGDPPVHVFHNGSLIEDMTLAPATRLQGDGDRAADMATALRIIAARRSACLRMRKEIYG
jgi:hypothetical protein